MPRGGKNLDHFLTDNGNGDPLFAPSTRLSKQCIFYRSKYFQHLVLMLHDILFLEAQNYNLCVMCVQKNM